MNKLNLHSVSRGHIQRPLSQLVGVRCLSFTSVQGAYAQAVQGQFVQGEVGAAPFWIHPISHSSSKSTTDKMVAPLGKKLKKGQKCQSVRGGWKKNSKKQQRKHPGQGRMTGRRCCVVEQVFPHCPWTADTGLGLNYDHSLRGEPILKQRKEWQRGTVMDQPHLPFPVPLHCSAFEETSWQWIGAEPGKMALVLTM